jgi:phosphatidylserine/phosphatidylglycerophosphate/cardiolipin synthase-like enzyme
MKHAWLAVAIFACGVPVPERAPDGVPPEPSPPEQATPGPAVAERTLLRWVNRAASETLSALGPSLDGVVRHRAGPDGVFLTTDDRPLVAALDLDALGVTPVDRARLDEAARAAAPSDEACTAGALRNLAAELLVTPGTSDGVIVSRIDAATSSIDLVMYQLRSTNVRAALARAARRGVAVRVLLDRTQESAERALPELVAAGAQARLSSERFVYTHQKTLLLDRKTLFVFTGNFDRASFGSGRNYGVFLREPEDIWDAEDLFEADWNDRDADLPCTRLVVAPSNARDRLVELIDGARQAVVMEALYASDSRVLDALVRAKERGAAVRVLFNDPSFGVGDATDEARILRQGGIDVRRSPELFIHAKLVVVDDRTAFVGSENFSTNSLLRNREVGVVVSAPAIDAGEILAVFERDFAAGLPFAP